MEYIQTEKTSVDFEASGISESLEKLLKTGSLEGKDLPLDVRKLEGSGVPGPSRVVKSLHLYLASSSASRFSISWNS